MNTKPSQRSLTKNTKKNKKIPRQPGLTRPDHVWTFKRSCNIQQNVAALGFVPSVGATSSDFFSLRFTNMDAYVWLNSTNYSTVSVPGYTDLSALFDQVQVKSIEITIIGLNLPLSYGAGSSNGSTVLLLATDYHDGNAPTAVGDVQQFQDVKIVHLDGQSEFKCRLEPKFLTYTLNAAGTSVPGEPIRGFVNSDQQIDHYGMKGCLLSYPSAASGIMFL